MKKNIMYKSIISHQLYKYAFKLLSKLHSHREKKVLEEDTRICKVSKMIKTDSRKII